MQVRTSLRAAGSSHPGLVRDHNEDRFLSDPDRGLFVVVDGVGGQAAGETAAETALSRLRARLEREAGPVEQRIREAITDANNEVFRLARSRPDWAGMACVLTAVVVEGTHAVVGHVGDTRLYKIRAGRIQKLTRDHSPVGEREDAGELTEAEAMRHPRRNEVYRDVGSEQHRAGDDGFIDTFTVPFEIDSALLICSDGLSDLVNAETMLQRVEAYAGHPYEVTRALIEAANDAGGKDNVTAVYVEGSRFAEGEDTGAVRRSRPVPPAQGTPWVAAEPAPGPAAKGRGRPARLGPGPRITPATSCRQCRRRSLPSPGRRRSSCRAAARSLPRSTAPPPAR
jgi:serine/threonine protein phosphatase PrpC